MRVGSLWVSAPDAARSQQNPAYAPLPIFSQISRGEYREHYGPSVLAVLEPILYYINIINSCVWSTQPRLYTFLLLARKHIIGVECVNRDKMFYLDYILQSRFIF